MASIKDLIRNPFISAAFVFLAIVLVLNPLGEFGVNDDWIYRLNVESFLRGDFTINALVDPSVIVHLVFGYVWALMFGSSFAALRLLTVVQALFFLLGTYKVLGALGVIKNIKLLVLLTLVTNPLIVASSLTFMSEIVFLLFTVWGLYFFVLSLQKNRLVLYVLSLVSFGLAFLVRQPGIVPFIALFAVYCYTFVKTKDARYFKQLGLTLGAMLLAVAVLYLWPRYSSTALTESGLADLATKLIEPKDLPKRLIGMTHAVFYLGYFFSPMGVALLPQLTKKVVLSIGVFALLLAAYVFSIDIFATGNVFYVEGFYIKSNFRNNFSLFDNVVFKIALAYYVAFFTLLLAALVVRSLKTIKGSVSSTVLVLTIIGFTSVLLLGGDLYERYFLPTIVSLLILFAATLGTLKLNGKVLAAISLIGVHMLVSHYDFSAQTPLIWHQAASVSEQTGYINQLYVTGPYQKFAAAKKSSDSTGLTWGSHSGADFKCFVDSYTLDTDSQVLRLAQGIDDYLANFITNPKIYGSSKIDGLPRIKNNLDQLIFNTEYRSPMYNLVGKRAFVGAWCETEEATK